MKTFFDHEKLEVYQTSLQFIAWSEPVTELLPKSLSVADQLERARTSIPLNIAEGNGPCTSPDRCRFFDTARGSALECAACLDVLFVRRRIAESQLVDGKERLRSIVSMLVGLIRANSEERMYEDSVPYRIGAGEQEKEKD
jgi:four helix bundle protein